MQERTIEAEKMCAQLLLLIAEQTNRKLNDFTIEFYMQRLGEHGYDRALLALKNLAESARFFPTVADIRDAMGIGDLSDGAKSREVAALISGGVAKFGEVFGSGEETADLRDRKMEKIMDHIGPVGWAVVEMSGGWNRICEVLTPANTGTYQAQWRELAAAVLEKDRFGHDGAPQLPSSADRFLGEPKARDWQKQCDQLRLQEAKEKLTKLKGDDNDK